MKVKNQKTEEEVEEAVEKFKEAGGLIMKLPDEKSHKSSYVPEKHERSNRIQAALTEQGAKNLGNFRSAQGDSDKLRSGES